MWSCLLALVSVAQTQEMVRAWTVLVDDNPKVAAHGKGLACVVGDRQVLGLRESDGSIAWQFKAENYISQQVQVGERAVLCESSERSCTLRVCDWQSGKTIRQIPIQGEVLDLASDGTGFFALTDKEILGYNIDGKLLRTYPYQAKKGELRSTELYVAPDTILAAIGNTGYLALDRQSGKTLWTKPDLIAGLYRCAIAGGLALLSGDDDIVCDLRTGKRVWGPVPELKCTALSQSVLVTEGEGDLVGREWKTGRELWRRKLGSRGYGIGSMATVSEEGDMFYVSADSTLAIDLKGNLLWTSPNARPVYANRRFAISLSSYQVMGYRPGSLPPLPSDEAAKAKLTQHLVGHYELLDQRERDRLRPLAAYSVVPLLKRYVEWQVAYQKREESRHYNLTSEAGDLLAEIVQKSDTKALLGAIEEIAQSAKAQDAGLLNILKEKGDPNEGAEILVRLVKGQTDERHNNPALDVLAVSTHPAAVGFLLDALADPKAPKEWRREAFQHLAGTGGEAGVAAVRAAMPQRKPLPTWQKRFRTDEKKILVGPKKGADGRNWVLVKSHVLGHYADLYLCEKTAKGLGEPHFIGLYTERTFMQEAPKQFRAMPVKKFLATEWIKLLPQDKLIRKDQDGDGLTDLVEARLGSHPQRADTDGDGMRDDVDPCPNAAPRKLGDREKIVAAAVAAKFFVGWQTTPATISVDGVEPFELYGYGLPLYWESEKNRNPLHEVYGAGMNSIGFHNFFENKMGDWLELSPDGKRAQLMITRYSGGLNGEGEEVKLIKVGDEWFVVEITMRYVS